MSLYLWDNEFRNKKILFHCDNAAVLYAVNTLTSKSDKVMTLLRALPLKCLLLNIVAKAKHIPGMFYITDSLSRLQFDKFPDWHHKQKKNQRLFRARFGNIQSTTREPVRASLVIDIQMTYKNAISAFNKFRFHHNLGSQWPAAVIHVQYFISSCFERGFSPATISSYCSGISFFHKINHLSDPTSTFNIQKMPKGCMQSRKQHDNRAPISKEMLTDICSRLNQICSSHYEMLLFTATFSLAYYGLQRVSELVNTGPIHN